MLPQYRLPDCARVHQVPREAENNQHSSRDWFQLLLFWPQPPGWPQWN